MSAADRVFAPLGNGRALPLADLPPASWEELSSGIVEEVARGARVSALFAAPAGPTTEAYVVLADDEAGSLLVGRAPLGPGPFPSLTPTCHQVHLFEREIHEDTGLVPEGHPWLKPVRGRGAASSHPVEAPRQGTFFRVGGEGLHEVAVGPVHAGVIEPGHFRFQCRGEEVLHLEIALGYQHRGLEEALAGAGPARRLRLAEAIAGDTSIGHGTSACQVMEALAGASKTAHAQAVRGLSLELERIANHVGDLGALAGDVGYLPTASFCGRLRGDVLNMTALLCGSRFGRGLLSPGGVGFSLEASRAALLAERVAKAEAEIAEAVGLLWSEQSVMARFEDTGTLSREAALDLGIVGPAARASGLPRDVRYSHPTGIFRFVHLPVSTWESGDVFARAYVRWLEVQQSFTFIREQLKALPGIQEGGGLGDPTPESLAVALTEGWRGEICHVGLTDASGSLRRYKVVDPSFHNWFALAQVLRGGDISDFPLCNKSFNLSYCGHDL